MVTDAAPVGGTRASFAKTYGAGMADNVELGLRHLAPLAIPLSVLLRLLARLIERESVDLQMCLKSIMFICGAAMTDNIREPNTTGCYNFTVYI